MSGQNSLRLFFKPFSSQTEHRSPCSSNDISWSASSHTGCGVDTTIPLGVGEELVLSKSLFSEHQKRTTFGSEGILVRVARNGGHAWNTEIELCCKFESQFLNERVDVAADAAV
jgi:hypothetical protein